VALAGDRIVAVGRRTDVVGSTAGAERWDLGPAVLLPGVVNAHVHVELSWMREDPPPGGDVVRWVRGLLERRRSEEPARARAAAEDAVAGMVARGTAAAGDVGNGTWVVPLLARSPLHGVAFHEIYGFRAHDAEHLLRDATGRVRSLAADPDVAAAGERWRVVLTPHAAHTTSDELLRALARRSTALQAPLSIHVAESPAECELLAGGGGGFADLLRERGMWDDGWAAPGTSPVGHLDRLGVLSPRAIAVHCVQLGAADAARLKERGCRVVTCPRSNRRLGVGVTPVGLLLEQGVPVALGTDSLASAPDLDLFAEMAALREDHPGLAPATVLRMATLGGAEALGLAHRLGSIAPGKLARLAVVPLADDADDPLETVCSGPLRVLPLEDAPAEAA
jgi:cytosine/adenosine deaminase-related metal-dependent hydrolase